MRRMRKPPERGSRRSDIRRGEALTPFQKSRLRAIIDSFSGKRVAVVGDLMLDHFVRGGVSRISPEAPVPVVRVSQETFVPGGAGNVAHNIACLGGRVLVVGIVGSDLAARQLTGDLRSERIDTSRLVVDKARVTSQKCRIIAEHQQVVRFDRETLSPLSRQTEARVLRNLAGALQKADAVVISDYGKGSITPRILKAVISRARSRGIPVTVDPKVENFPRYRGVTCITPNLQEAWAGMRRVPQQGLAPLRRLGRDILKSLRCRSVLITRGGDGMSLFGPGRGRETNIPTQAQEVFDVTGAGDTVISVLTLALASGADIHEASLLANFAAGIVVGKLGTAATDCSELVEAVR